MASITPRGNKWRVFIRRKGSRSITKTFNTKAAAERWAKQTDKAIVEGKIVGTDATLGAVIERYIDETDEYKPMGHSKRAQLEMIRRSTLGARRCADLPADVLIDWVKLRRKSVTAGTVKQDLIYIHGVLKTAKHLFGVAVNLDEMEKTFAYAARYGLIGSSHERDRRPTDVEIDVLKQHWAKNKRKIPMGDLVDFAIATCMRLGEIVNLRWSDLDTVRRTIVIRDRKHPTDKLGNDQEVPLLFGSFDMIMRREKTGEHIWPYDNKSISSSFNRAVKATGINDLHFHDLRHEGISRMFEHGYSIMEVAKVSGHRDIRMLRRYVQLDAADLHRD